MERLFSHSWIAQCLVVQAEIQLTRVAVSLRRSRRVTPGCDRGQGCAFKNALRSGFHDFGIDNAAVGVGRVGDPDHALNTAELGATRVFRGYPLDGFAARDGAGRGLRRQNHRG